MAMFLDGVGAQILRDIMKPPSHETAKRYDKKPLNLPKHAKWLMTSSEVEDKEELTQGSHSDHQYSSNNNSNCNKDKDNRLGEPTREIGATISSIQVMPQGAITTPLYPWTLTAEKWTVEEKDHLKNESLRTDKIETNNESILPALSMAG